MRPNGYTLTALLLGALALALPAQAQYGVGVTLQVPVADGAITLDGMADEAAWDAAQTVDLTAQWNSGWAECAGDEAVPDVFVEGKLLWSEGTLYLYVTFQDYQDFYWGEPGGPWAGESILVGVDLTHAEDDQTDDNYSGWPDNAPDLGPVAYKVTGALGEGSDGLTHDWGYTGLDPVGSGWIDGSVFVDNDAFQWGVEMAVYGEEITQGGEIGFNIGGSSAFEPCVDELEGDGNYAYFSWQAASPPASAGGDVMNNSASFATLHFVTSVDNEGTPGGTATLLRAYPNPFSGSATVAYELERAGTVELAVYDVLGRRVAVLDAGLRSADEHRVAFDAAGLPAGLYLVRLTVDGAAAATRTITRH